MNSSYFESADKGPGVLTGLAKDFYGERFSLFD